MKAIVPAKRVIDCNASARVTADGSAADPGVEIAARLKVLKTEEPPTPKAGGKVAPVAVRVGTLKTEAGAL